MALPESVKQVHIVPLGRARLLTPAGEAWDSGFEGDAVTSDFMSEREQPEGTDIVIYTLAPMSK